MNPTMKAFVRTSAETQEVALKEVNIPVIEADEVLIKVEAFGVGIHDRYFIPTEIDFPYVIGSEGAGEITAIGSEVIDYAIGDKVIFTSILQKKGGSWAEFAVAKQDVLIKLPENVTSQQGAAVPIAGKTALECMRELTLDSGDSLFIAGASGAIGTFVLQLANLKQLKIAASASAKNHEYMKSLGAGFTVDYKNPDWTTKVKNWSNGGVSAALAIQPGTANDSIKVIKNGGLLITVSGDHASVVPERNIEIRQMGHKLNSSTELQTFVHSISQGKLNIVIEKEYEFENALDALEKTETRRARGKVIVNVR